MQNMQGSSDNKMVELRVQIWTFFKEQMMRKDQT